MQQWSFDYWKTYAPVVNWISVRLLLTLSVVHGWYSRSMDFVLAFPEAKLEEDVYMKLPAGITNDEVSRK